MKPQTKTRKRVLLLAVLGVTAALAAFGAYQYRQFQLDREAVDAGEAGREALARADYTGALDGIGRYVGRFQDRGVSAEDYVLYARARRHVEVPSRRHLLQAIAALRKATAIDPQCADASEDLLDVCLAAGYATEALDVLDTLIARSPGDLGLLRTRFEVFTQLRQYAKALATAREINRVAPDYLPGFLATLASMTASGAPSGELDAWVTATLAAHPADPRFELLRAALLVRRGDAALSGPVLDRLLLRTSDTRDPEFIDLLVRQLDAAERFADSLRTLERVGADAGEMLRLDLVRRLWYAGRPGDVVTRIEAGGSGSDPELIALHALALIALGRRHDAEALRRDLDARDDPAGRAWSAFVAHEFGGRSTTPREDCEALNAAAVAVPGSAFIRHAVGDASSALGEHEMAIDAWTAAADRAPTWARPLREIAKVLLATPGREPSALAAARAALSRAPNDAATIATYLRAVAADGRDMNAAQRDALIEVVKSLQGEAPEQAEVLLPLQVSLVARGDRDAAERRLRELILARTPMGEAGLLDLARVAAEAGIPLESELLVLSTELNGISARLAVARAVSVSRTEGPWAGLRAFDGLRAAAPATVSTVEWDVARATYLDRSRLPEALPAWVALTDAHPDRLEVQLRVLASATAWGDRAAIDRAIERTRAQTGERGTTWRVARGRWLLFPESPEAPETAEAARILAAVCRDAPMNSAAHLLLARALERLGNLRGAEAQLRIASDPGAGDPRIALELSRLAELQGRSGDAREHLDRALDSRDLAPDLSATTAHLLAARGELARSRGILEPLASAGRADRRGLVLLARLHADLGETDRAIALCERLLTAPDPEVVELAAGLYEAVGRTLDARGTLSRLDAMDMPAGARDLVRARHAASWGTREDAVAAFRRAVAAAPANETAWSQFLEFVISKCDAASLGRLLAEPGAADVERVRFLRGLGPLVPDAMSDPRLRPLLVAVVNDHSARNASMAAIRAIVEGRGEPGRRAEVARVVVALAEANARVLPLQILAADVAAASGDLKRGIETARRAMNEFPGSAEGARQAAMMLASAGRMEEALEAGLAWRDRVNGRYLLADVFVSQVMLRLGRAADAAANLERSAGIALARPADNETFLLTYCVALTRSGRAARATEVLAGLSRESDRWVLLPLTLEPKQWMATAADAGAWLAVCSANVPEDDPRFRLPLARTWGAAWDRFHTAEMLSRAREILRTLIAMPGSTAEVWHEAGLLEHKAGDFDAALRLYRGALERDAAHAVTHNDLAMLLADAGRWQEAIGHASAATKLVPSSANHLDTLACVLRKGGKLDEATAALVEACRLEPMNPAWRLGLAEIRAESGELDEAKRETARVEEMTSIGSEPSAALRERLERLRSRLR